MSNAALDRQGVISACHCFLEKHNRRQEERLEREIRRAMEPRGWFRRTRTREEAADYVNRALGIDIRLVGVGEANRVRDLRNLSMAASGETILVSGNDFSLIRHWFKNTT